MKKVKITVLKRTFQEDLAKEYAVDGFGNQYAFALAHGGGKIPPMNDNIIF